MRIDSVSAGERIKTSMSVGKVGFGGLGGLMRFRCKCSVDDSEPSFGIHARPKGYFITDV